MLPLRLERRARFLKNKKFLQGREYEVFIWEADFRAYNLALALGSGRVVLLRVLARLDEFLPEQAEAVFSSLADQEAEAAHLWSVYGLRFFAPSDLKLQSHSLKSGHLQLEFTRGKQTLRVHRLSMARIMLKGAAIQDWYPVFFKKPLRDLVVDVVPEAVRECEGIRIEGRPRSRWRQLLRPPALYEPEAAPVYARARLARCRPRQNRNRRAPLSQERLRRRSRRQGSRWAFYRKTRDPS